MDKKMNELVKKMEKEHGSILYKGKTYVLMQDAYPSYQSFDPYAGYYEALAICPMEVVEETEDEEAYIPTYKILWKENEEFEALIKALANGEEWAFHENVEEGDACDWENPDFVTLEGKAYLWGDSFQFF